MIISIGSDHAGYEAKATLIEHLKQNGHEVLDLGPENADRVDYPDFAKKVAQTLSEGKAEKAILICGTGIGMSMAANKVNGIRAAVVHDEFTAQMSREHNDANVLCMGTRTLSLIHI